MPMRSGDEAAPVLQLSFAGAEARERLGLEAGRAGRASGRAGAGRRRERGGWEPLAWSGTEICSRSEGGMDMPVLAKVPECVAGLLRVSCERLGAAAPLTEPETDFSRAALRSTSLFSYRAAQA